MTTAPKRIPARPDNKPYDLDLDAVKAEVELTPFVFHWAGKRWAMIHALELDMWDLIEAADLGDLAAMSKALETAMGDAEKWKAFRATPMPQYKMKALWEAYQKHAGVEPGEFQRSTAS